MKQSISLNRGETWSVPARVPAPVKVASGAVWVTYEGIAEDFIYREGETIALGVNGKRPVLGALKPETTLVLDFKDAI